MACLVGSLSTRESTSNRGLYIPKLSANGSGFVMIVMDLRTKLYDVLKEFSLDDIFDFEENYDEQYLALRNLHYSIKNPSIYLSIIILNAVVSYQLNCSGEAYWWEFSHYYSKRPPPDNNVGEEMRRFIIVSKCNRRLINQKIKRIEKAAKYVVDICRDWRRLIENQEIIAYQLAGILNTDPDSKTIVFAVKMLNYGLRILTGKKLPAPFGVDIPLDSRIIKISKKLGLKEPRAFWRDLSRRINIPQLHIDSLLWVGYRLASNKPQVDDKRLSKLIRLLQELLSSNSTKNKRLLFKRKKYNRYIKEPSLDL